MFFLCHSTTISEYQKTTCASEKVVLLKESISYLFCMFSFWNQNRLWSHENHCLTTEPLRKPFFCVDTLLVIVWFTRCAHVCLSASVIQVLFLPCGGRDGAVGVHDDLCTTDDHGHQQQAEEGDAGQSQALVHVHESWLRSTLHLHDCCCLLLLSSDTPSHAATILKTDWRYTETGRGWIC